MFFYFIGMHVSSLVVHFIHTVVERSAESHDGAESHDRTHRAINFVTTDATVAGPVCPLITYGKFSTT